MHRHYLRMILALLALALIVVVPASAYTINYSVLGTGPMHFPGPVTPPANAPWGPNGYPGDTIEFVGEAGQLIFSGTSASLVQKVSTLKWIIDYTYAGDPDDPDNWHELQFDVDGQRGITLGSESGLLDQAGLLEVNWDNDYLTLFEGPTRSFIVDNFKVDVTPLGLARVGGVFTGGNPWIQPDRDVMARFDIEEVPEPTALVTGSMLLTLFGAAKLRLQHRRRRQ